MADPAGPAGSVRGFRSIDTLAELVGCYCWVEHRIFEMTGAWATDPGGRDGRGDRGGRDVSGPADAERRVWCAAASRRHGALSMRWRECLPMRAGVDRAALVAPASGRLRTLLKETASASDPWEGLAGLVDAVLPGLTRAYAAHLASASAVSEGPVAEVLMEARRQGLRDAHGGAALLQRAAGSRDPRSRERARDEGAGDADGVVEQAFETFGIFPAVRPS